MIDRLGSAVSSGDLAQVAACYEFPAMYLSEEAVMVIDRPEELQKFFGEGRKWYIEHGIVEAKGNLLEYDAVGKKIASIDVRWPGFDSDGNEIYTETSKYIVVDSEAGVKIRVAMSRTG